MLFLYDIFHVRGPRRVFASSFELLIRVRRVSPPHLESPCHFESDLDLTGVVDGFIEDASASILPVISHSLRPIRIVDRCRSKQRIGIERRREIRVI